MWHYTRPRIHESLNRFWTEIESALADVAPFSYMAKPAGLLYPSHASWLESGYVRVLSHKKKSHIVNGIGVQRRY